MSTTPPSEPPTEPSERPPDEQPTRHVPRVAVVSSTGDIARLPIPGNAELVVWLLAIILFGIISLASDAVDAPLFVGATAAVTFAYLISRGIAKAGRVLEQ